MIMQKFWANCLSMLEKLQSIKIIIDKQIAQNLCFIHDYVLKKS